METLVADVLTGAAIGGGGQVVSNVFRLGLEMVKGLTVANAAEREQERKDQSLYAKLYVQKQTAAKGRFGGLLTGIVFVLIVIAAFYGIFYAAATGIPTNVIQEKEPWLNFFGILKIGGGYVVQTMEGLVIPVYIQRGAIMVVSAITAIKATKTVW